MRRAGGFSLGEVILTASLTAIIFLFLLNIVPGAMLGIRRAEHRVEAQALAQSLLDRCRAGPFANLETNGTYTSTSPGFLGSNLDPVELEDHTRLIPSVDVSGVTGCTASRNNLAQVKVTVVWEERSEPHQVTAELQIVDMKR